VQDLLGGGESVFGAALARDAEELLRRRAEITAQPSASTKDVREKEQLAEAAGLLREPIEQSADETLGVALDDPEIGDPFHWEIEFPEVFLTTTGRPRRDGGFDAIIGNPPYIQIQSLGRPSAEFCRDRYRVAAGAFDVYVVFIERALELLRPAGRLGFIVPNKFTKLEMGEGLRELLVEGKLIEEILDFGDAQLFGATNYTAILILDSSGRGAAFQYRKLVAPVGDPVVEIEAMEPSEFSGSELGSSPWILATPSERRILDAASAGALTLATATDQIFQGLITSADSVYIVEDLGPSGALRRVRSKASGNVVELEPNLLHPLASGPDVERYAFLPLRQLLLFPYERRAESDAMNLVPWAWMEELPRTARYLRDHEDALRGREGGKLDHDRWYAFSRTQSLGLHDLPKLGVAATVNRLEVAADLAGAIYFHNVRVNGILATEGGPGLEALLVLLNSRLLDYIFRLHSVPLANQYFAANKQFIAPLPIKMPDANGATLDALGKELHGIAGAIGAERKGFLDWLDDRIGIDPRSLPGKSKLSAYESHPIGELLSQLDASAKRLAVDPGSRAFRDQFTREHSASVEKLHAMQSDLARVEAEADCLVYDIYGIAVADRTLVDDEYRAV
jgi:hypothetical protein